MQEKELHPEFLTHTAWLSELGKSEQVPASFEDLLIAGELDLRLERQHDRLIYSSHIFVWHDEKLIIMTQRVDCITRATWLDSNGIKESFHGVERRIEGIRSLVREYNKLQQRKCLSLIAKDNQNIIAGADGEFIFNNSIEPYKHYNAARIQNWAILQEADTCTLTIESVVHAFIRKTGVKGRVKALTEEVLKVGWQSVYGEDW